jgi:hypothetical protein
MVFLAFGVLFRKAVRLLLRLLFLPVSGLLRKTTSQCEVIRHVCNVFIGCEPHVFELISHISLEQQTRLPIIAKETHQGDGGLINRVTGLRVLMIIVEITWPVETQFTNCKQQLNPLRFALAGIRLDRSQILKRFT